jgi:hypothetical protein
MGSQQTQNTSQNNNTNYSGTATSAPGWAPQVSALTAAFNQAPGALATAQSYKGPQGTNTNFDTSGLYGNGSTLNTSGTNAASSGLGALSNFNAGATNNPQSLIDSAKQFADGQNIGAQTNAALQQAREQVRDVTLPGIQQNAAIGNNTDSSRNGIAQGLVERSLAEIPACTATAAR